MGDLNNVVLSKKRQSERFVKHNEYEFFSVQTSNWEAGVCVLCHMCRNASIPVLIEVLLWLEAQGSFKISFTSCLHSYCNRILTFWYFKRESAFGQHISPDLCPSAHSPAKVDMVVRMKADAVDFTLILPKRHCAHPLVFRADVASQFLPLKRQK